ncbi:hypothetical protein [Polynucleobacter duraquae]|nr:hypothetical protein [Polynucleobacter duraquae]
MKFQAYLLARLWLIMVELEQRWVHLESAWRILADYGQQGEE